MYENVQIKKKIVIFLYSYKEINLKIETLMIM